MKNIEDILEDLNRFREMNVLEEHENGEDVRESMKRMIEWLRKTRTYLISNFGEDLVKYARYLEKKTKKSNYICKKCNAKFLISPKEINPEKGRFVDFCPVCGQQNTVEEIKEEDE